MTSLIAFDTETTGFGRNDRICQLSAVLFDPDSLEVLEEFDQYIDPRVPINPQAQQITGLTNAFLAGKPTFEEVWPGFRDFIQGRHGVAHNAPFDIRMLNQELEALDPQLRLDSAMPQITDTASLARKAFPGQPVNLDNLPRLLHLQLPARGNHDGLDDCRRLARIYVPLMKIVEPKLRQQRELMDTLIGPGLPADADLDAVIERLCALDTALAPLLAAQASAKTQLAALVNRTGHSDRRIEVTFTPKAGSVDWAKVRDALPENFDLDSLRKDPPTPSMKVKVLA